MSDFTIQNIKPEHASGLRELQLICFPTVPPDELFSEADFLAMCDEFPEGVFVVTLVDRVVGLGAGIFVDFDFAAPDHTMAEILEAGHNPKGAYYYGTDISVHPEFRQRGLGRQLYEKRKDVVRRFNRQGIVAGGFIPGYAKHKGAMLVEEYVERVVAGELHDPTLSMQLRNGFEVKGILTDYMPVGASDGYATLILWTNPAYKATAS